jgi:hypothetical protein
MDQLRDRVAVGDLVGAGAGLNARLEADLGHGRAHARFVHGRARDWVKDPRTGLLVPDLRWRDSPVFGPGGDIDPDCIEVLGEDEAWNLITNAGRIFLHTQGYGTSGLGSNGLNFIALSNDTVTETSTSTVLSNEIATNGLGRAVGTVVLPTGSGNQTTIAKTFTATGAQSAQKAALFTAGSSGTMNHVLSFTQRSLISGDTLAVTFTITLG